MIFCKKALCFRAEPQLPVGRKADPGKRCQRNFAPPAFRKLIITDFFNQGRFQQGFTADEVEDNRPCVPIDKIGIIFLVQAQQIINDFLPRFDAHVLGAFVVFIAVRAPQVASTRHLKRDISTRTSRFGQIPAVQALNRIAIILKPSAFQTTAPPPG